MSGNYTKSKRADQDIIAITLRSLVDFGEAQTDKYMAGMKTTLETLAENPSSGREFTHKKTQRVYLYYRYVSHVVYYRQRKNDILILRIIHSLQGYNPKHYTVHVNGPWCITFEFEGGNAYQVDFEQYH